MTPPEQKYLLKVPDEVAALLKNLHPEIRSHIRSGLKTVLDDPYKGKALKDELQGLRSYRVKRYRIIYRILPSIKHIEIITIGPRRVIYEETFYLLSRK